MKTYLCKKIQLYYPPELLNYITINSAHQIFFKIKENIDVEKIIVTKVKLSVDKKILLTCKGQTVSNIFSNKSWLSSIVPLGAIKDNFRSFDDLKKILIYVVKNFRNKTFNLYDAKLLTY